MPRQQGDLIPVGELHVGQLVDGHAKDGLWWPAKVVSKEGEGADASAELNFITFGPRFNETFKDLHQAVRVRLPKAQRDVENMPERWRENIHLRNPDGTWPVKKILGKRKRGGRVEHRVRWEVRLRLRLRACACLPARETPR